MDNTQNFTHISLCSGYGGIDLGLKRAIGNLITIAYSEIEGYAAANLVAKIESGLLDAAPIWSNLKTFPWQHFRDRVDIISGGFPCQPFSAAGQSRGDEDPRHLFPYIKRGIEIVRPALVFLENVEGIIGSKLKGKHWRDDEGTPVLLHVCRELERLGYQVAWGIFSAAEIGAPHQRKRVFILANSSKLSGDSLPYDLRSQLRELPAGIDSGVYPAMRGQPQYNWEPSRVNLDNPAGRNGKSPGGQLEPLEKKTPAPLRKSSKNLDNPNGKGLARNVQQRGNNEERSAAFTGSSSSRNIQRAIKPEVGRNLNGVADWMDYDQLCKSVYNRVDELRLLGNGVVPATAERAFRVLWRKLGNSDQ